MDSQPGNGSFFRSRDLLHGMGLLTAMAIIIRTASPMKVEISLVRCRAKIFPVFSEHVNPSVIGPYPFHYPSEISLFTIIRLFIAGFYFFHYYKAIRVKLNDRSLERGILLPIHEFNYPARLNSQALL